MAACIAKFSGTIKKQEDEFVSICIDEEFGSPASVHGCPTHDVALHVINAVRKQRPKTFDVFPSGNLCGIVSATARISQDAMRNLPLVDDLVSSAEWTSDDSSEGQSTQFKPPVGIWPLVSLLLFLEAGLDDKEVRRWLTSTSGDPKLLGDTLQMADFMGAKKHVTKELCGIFTDVLRSIRHANVKDITGVELCSDEKFKCMVVSNLPDRFCKDALTDKFSLEEAFCKPDDAFVQWLQGHGPTLQVEHLLSKQTVKEFATAGATDAKTDPPPRDNLFGSSRASPSAGPTPATQPSASLFGSSFGHGQQPQQPQQGPSIPTSLFTGLQQDAFAPLPGLFGTPAFTPAGGSNVNTRSPTFGHTPQQPQQPSDRAPTPLFGGPTIPSPVSGTTNEAASAAQREQNPSRGKGKAQRSAKHRSGTGVFSDSFGCSYPAAGHSDASRKASPFDKLFRCLQRCPGINTLQGSMVTLNAMAEHCAGQGDSSAGNCPIQRVHFDNIVMEEVSEKFAENLHPLGIVGSCVKLLCFKSVSLSSKRRRPTSLPGMPDSTLEAARRWAFFRAIGRLKSMKQLAVPLDFWADITSCGMDVTAPLQDLQDLVVEAASDGHVIARVVDRRVVQELQETTEQFTQAEASKVENITEKLCDFSIA